MDDKKPMPEATANVEARNFIRDMVLFYPWYHQDAAHTTGRVPATDMLHERVVDLMKAGPRYAVGYRAVYGYATRQALRNLIVPAMLCVAHADVLAHHARRALETRSDLSVRWLDGADRLGLAASAINAFLDSA